jgi:hypothetical protein
MYFISKYNVYIYIHLNIPTIRLIIHSMRFSWHSAGKTIFDNKTPSLRYIINVYVDRFVQMIVYCCVPYETRSVFNMCNYSSGIIFDAYNIIRFTIHFNSVVYTHQLNIVLIVCEKVQNVRQHTYTFI